MSTWVHELYRIPRWKKYSQANEESYLEFILKNIHSTNRFILELGAWDGYHLSNTRHFIEQGYKGLLIDGDNKGNDEVKKHFITKENILTILDSYACPKAFDLFCIDLDGNDLYIIEEVLKEYRPSVIIAEFNPKFQPNESFVIKYNPSHIWQKNDFYGFSFLAGSLMAEKNGYTVVFQNDALNMYFIDNEILAQSLQTSIDEIPKLIPKATYKPRIAHPKALNSNWLSYK